MATNGIQNLVIVPTGSSAAPQKSCTNDVYGSKIDTRTKALKRGKIPKANVSENACK